MAICWKKYNSIHKLVSPHWVNDLLRAKVPVAVRQGSAAAHSPMVKCPAEGEETEDSECECEHECGCTWIVERSGCTEEPLTSPTGTAKKSSVVPPWHKSWA